jgi:hypothetical protein
MTVSMQRINSWIDEYLSKNPDIKYKNWKELKVLDKQKYNELVDLAFDELHPY